MKSTLCIAAALIVSLAAAPSVFAQWGWFGKSGPGSGYAAVVQAGVLTPDQHRRILTMQQQFLQETAGITNQLQQKQLALHGHMLDSAPDAGAVMNLRNEVSDLQAQLAAKQAQFQLESRNLLTAEQIAQLPPGCTPGFGSRWCGRGPGKGFGMGRGYNSYGAGCGMGPGYGRGYAAGFGCGW